MAAAQVPGDTYRNLQIHPILEQTFKHILVPVWLLTYNYGASVSVVVNGDTAMAGHTQERVEYRAARAACADVLMIFLYLQD